MHVDPSPGGLDLSGIISSPKSSVTLSSRLILRKSRPRAEALSGGWTFHSDRLLSGAIAGQSSVRTSRPPSPPIERTNHADVRYEGASVKGALIASSRFRVLTIALRGGGDQRAHNNPVACPAPPLRSASGLHRPRR
jgi:hypothetical protein